MFTTDHITTTTSKFDEVLSKRARPRDPSDSPIAYQSLSIVKKLSKAKFPVYLTSSRVNKQNYAMKIFTQASDQAVQELYKNEVRFASLKHPNVIDIINYEEDRKTIQQGQIKKISYILMEFAPYGDFFEFIINHKTYFNEKLTRTFFRQLINGIEYLHERGVAHLDLKPENLLLGADFNLKIADFDLSHACGDGKILSGGTRGYRGPEFIRTSPAEIKLEDPFAADIYSAGIILFIFMSAGVYPHSEDKIIAGTDFADLMYKNPKKFWAKHCEIQKKEASFFSDDFKKLFENMVKFNPDERLTIKEVKQSKWYNGPIYTPMELEDKMKEIIYH